MVIGIAVNVLGSEEFTQRQAVALPTLMNERVDALTVWRVRPEARQSRPRARLLADQHQTHIGGTGHSQGGFATTSAAGDSHITTIAPLCGASNQRNLHGPAMLFCGGMDTTVPCSTISTMSGA